MRNDETWHFARTEVINDPAVAETHFRKLVQSIESACVGFINYPRDFQDNSPLDFRSDRMTHPRFKDHAEHVSFETHYLQCPLPMFHLPNHTRPFVVDKFALGGTTARAFADFDSAGDKVLAEIWEVVVAKKIQASLTQTWKHAESDSSFNVSLDCKFAPSDGDELIGSRFMKLETELVESPIRTAMDEALDKLGLVAEETKDVESGHSCVISRWNCPAVKPVESLLQTAIELERGMASIGGWEPRWDWSLGVREPIASYQRIRNGRCFDDVSAFLNEVHRDWNMELFAFYHTDFDPFQDPEIIPAESREIRLPMGRLRRSPVWFDIIHDAEGTFLELRSTSRRSIINTAKKATLELEFWEGKPSERWLPTPDQ